MPGVANLVDSRVGLIANAKRFVLEVRPDRAGGGRRGETGPYIDAAGIDRLLLCVIERVV
jgi:hypothetical protein